MNQVEETPTRHHVTVFLGGNEWGNELMLKVAEDLFSLSTDKENLLVTVHEHAGWYLSYAMINENIRCVSSANDRAEFPEEVRRYWESNQGVKTTLEVIRRPNAEETLTPA